MRQQDKRVVIPVTRPTHADRPTPGHRRAQFDADTASFHRLLTERLGRTVLMTNRLDWSAEHVVAAYGGPPMFRAALARPLRSGPTYLLPLTSAGICRSGTTSRPTSTTSRSSLGVPAWLQK